MEVIMKRLFASAVTSSYGVRSSNILKSSQGVKEFSTAKYFHPRVKVNNNMLRLYRRRLKELAGPLGLRNSEVLKDFYPKFNKSHLSEELRALVTEVPEDMKPVHKVKVLLRGIGYRASWAKGIDQYGKEITELKLRLGFSHELLMTVPPSVEIKEGDLKENTFIWVANNISSSDCQEIVLLSKNLNAVTQFASQIKRHRPPEPYKLKGVFVDTGKKRTNVIRKKAKSARS